MKETPINYEVVTKKIHENHITDVGKASIRLIKKLIDDIELENGQRFVRMGNGCPRFATCTDRC